MNKLFFNFILLISTFFFSCGEQQTRNMPNRDDIPVSNSLPIDGLYKMSSEIERGLKNALGIIAPDQKVRFEKGIAYYTSTSFWDKNLPEGKVFLKNIIKISDMQYSALFFPLSGLVISDTSYNVTILVDGNNLKINTPPLEPTKISQEINFELVNNETLQNSQQNPSSTNNNVSTDKYRPGYYIVNASENRKVYFHNTPDASTKRNAYFTTQEQVYITKIQFGYGYVEFTNTRGQTSYGWIKTQYLIAKPTN